MEPTHHSNLEFQSRHLGPRDADVGVMLERIGVSSMEALIDQTVPSQIRLDRPAYDAPPMTEQAYLALARDIAKKNKLFKSWIGRGYSGTITPSVILRNIFENPGWYTQYTPYQPEIAQGRLEALLNFQTMVSDLAGLPVANASLLDEGTAAAEAMSMVDSLHHRSAGAEARRFFVSNSCHAQTIDVVRSRALPHGIEIVVGDHRRTKIDAGFFGALLQYPAEDGAIHDYRDFIAKAHAQGMYVIVAADILSLALLTPPGEFGADVVVGSSQRFGVPMGYGGPHAAYLATRIEHIRQMPGRIIGVTVDSQNGTAYRMTLQTREQHIRREKATSNICTAQALLAIMAGMYGVWHGPAGIRAIAERVARLARLLDAELAALGYERKHDRYFDTLHIPVGREQARIRRAALKAGVNFRFIGGSAIGIALDETTELADVLAIRNIFARPGAPERSIDELRAAYARIDASFPEPFARSSAFMTHPVFNRYHSETEMMRYLKKLENRDLSLAHAMTPLGSCTMKLNAATEMIPVSWPEFAGLHPFAPPEQAAGYAQVFDELSDALRRMTGFAATSLMPNSGAQGELTGLLVIRAYQASKGEGRRNVALIPSSAHGTNPASAVMAGLTVVVVKCDDLGNIEVADLRAKAEEHRDRLCALIVTYPSTHGVFEESIVDLCRIVHENGGQVYMDGANLNAQLQLTSPARIGADVCHINLHKTFSIPHGGGGPGLGPICVAEHLAPFLPSHPVVPTGGEKGIPAVASAPWSSASIMLISYGYIKMLGGAGLRAATEYAILNANYLASSLEKDFPVLYRGAKGRVAHEFILNMKEFKESLHVEVEDIAKRLIDYGFHPPTVAFPVHDTLMVEPTESESKEELDRFIAAMRSIRGELRAIAEGKADARDNLLKNAPHCLAEAAGDEWKHPYTRAEAVYPLPALRDFKFWPPVGRVNNTYGDKNLMCTCPPMEDYLEG